MAVGVVVQRRAIRKKYYLETSGEVLLRNTETCPPRVIAL